MFEKYGNFNLSINVIYQVSCCEDVYKMVEEKAVNLIYFIAKNNFFIDGNKRLSNLEFVLLTILIRKKVSQVEKKLLLI